MPEWSLDIDTTNGGTITYGSMELAFSQEDELTAADEALLNEMVACLNKHFVEPK